MQYLGGKTRIAKEIAQIVNAERAARGGVPFWEPFCGGLSVSVQLAKAGPGIVSDAFPPLISLYQAVRAGWDPPETLSEDEYRAARLLPDSDPIKAFAGFGCSFGGRWFQGYARSGARVFAGETARAMRRDVPALGACALECLDFLEVAPRSLPVVIYCDPPYAGTKTYAGTPRFDSARFWSRVQGWERAGVPVFVSEYACPVPHRVEHEIAHRSSVDREGAWKPTTERLFRVLV